MMKKINGKVHLDKSYGYLKISDHSLSERVWSGKDIPRYVFSRPHPL